jgi:hypothetical protein
MGVWNRDCRWIGGRKVGTAASTATSAGSARGTSECPGVRHIFQIASEGVVWMVLCCYGVRGENRDREVEEELEVGRGESDELSRSR